LTPILKNGPYALLDKNHRIYGALWGTACFTA
jgi:hypothetical protein